MAARVTIAELVYKVVADTLSFASDMAKVDGGLSKLATGIKNNSAAFHTVGIAATAAGGAIVAGLGFATNSAIKYESAMSAVRKTTGMSKEEIDALKDTFFDMSTNIDKAGAIAVEELFQIGEVAGQLGIKGAENIAGFTEQIAKIGTVTEMTGAEAAESMAQIGAQSRISGENMADFAQRMGSTWNELANNTNAAERAIAEFQLRITGAGSAVGMTNAEIAGIATTFVNLGVPAEMGGTAVNTLIIKLQQLAVQGGEDLDKFAKYAGISSEEFAKAISEKPTEAFQLLIEGLGRSENKVMAISELFGSEQTSEPPKRLADALLRVGNAGELLATNINMATAAYSDGTSLQKEYAVQTETVAAKIELFKNNSKMLADTLGVILLPALNDIVVGLSAFMTELGRYLKEHPAITKAFVLLAGAIGGILIAIGPVLAVLPGLIMALESISAVAGVLAGVISGPLIIAIGALAAIAAVVYTQWDKVVQVWNIAKDAFSGFLSSLTGDGEAFKTFWLGLWSYIKDFFVEIWSYVIAYFDFIMERVSGFDQMVKDTFGSWENFWIFIGQMLQNVFSSIVNVFTVFFTSVLEGLQIFVDTVTGSFETVINGANWLLEKVGMEALPLIGDRFKDFSVDIKAFMEDAAAGVKGAFDSIFERGEKAKEENKKTLEEYKDGVKPPLEEATDAFVDHADKSGQAFSDLVGVVDSQANLMIDNLKYYSTKIKDVLDAANNGLIGAWERVNEKLNENLRSINKHWGEFTDEQKDHLDFAISNIHEFRMLSGEEYANLSDDAKKAFEATLDVIINYANGVEKSGSKITAAVDQMATDLARATRSIEANGVSIMAVNPQLKESFDTTYESIADNLTNFYRGMLTQEQLIENMAELIRAYAIESGESMQVVVEYFSEALGEMKDEVQDAVGASWFIDGMEKFIEWFAKLEESAKEKMTNVARTVKDSFGEIKNGVSDFIDPGGGVGGGAIKLPGNGESGPRNPFVPIVTPGMNPGGGGNVFNISQLVVREEADIVKIASQLTFAMQTGGFA